MENKKLIIVEGAQGTGKSTLTNYLRDHMSDTNLQRLSGHPIKTSVGRTVSTTMYDAQIQYLQIMQYIPMNIIYDRLFFSEEVYARLGFKEYQFTDQYIRLTEELVKLNYDIHYLALYLNNTDKFIERLKRDGKGHHNYQAFSLESSIKQQNMYMQIADELEQYSNINVHRVAMDEEVEKNQKIKKLFNIK